MYFYDDVIGNQTNNNLNNCNLKIYKTSPYNLTLLNFEKDVVHLLRIKNS